MQITRIGDKNYSFFEKMLFQMNTEDEEDVVRLGAIEDGVACGAAEFKLNGPTVELTNLYVAQEYRRHGAAKALLNTFLKMTKGTGVESIIATFMESEDGLYQFLDKQGFFITEGSPVFVFSAEEALASDKLKKYLFRNLQGKCTGLDSLSEYQNKELRNFLSQGGFPPQEVSDSMLTRELSAVVMDGYNRIDACMLCTDMGERICINILLSNAGSQIAVLLLFRYLYEKVKELARPGLEICYLAINPQIIDAIGMLLGDCVKEERHVMYGFKILEETGTPLSEGK